MGAGVKRAPFELNGQTVLPGRKKAMEIPVARLPTGTWLSMPVTVFHGRAEGPRVWLSAAIHGDELNGVEIVNSVMRELDVKALRGTVVAVPVVNVFGFINQSRYLPDGRDLNRSFPGSKRGSLAARLAAGAATADPPAATIASTTPAAADGSMSFTTTRAPAPANRSAMARPIPPAAPVTRTTLWLCDSCMRVFRFDGSVKIRSEGRKLRLELVNDGIVAAVVDPT